MTKHGTATNEQYGQILSAFIIAIATAIKDFAVNDILRTLPNKGEKLTQLLRLVFTALTTGQDLVLAGDQARTERPSILESISTRAVSAINEFNARDHFKVGTIKGVKIGYVSDNFKKHFLGKVETNVADAVLRSYKLLKNSLDPRIITDLGDNYSTTLAYMWELVAAQPNGEDGILLTNGYANIFYIQDEDGTFWAVRAYWNGAGWYFYARSVGSPYEWHAVNQVFGR